MLISQQDPLGVFASVVATGCVLVVGNEAVIRDNGWEFVDTKTHKLRLLDCAGSAQVAATLTFARNARPVDIFLKFFLPNLVSRLLGERMNENSGVLHENAGNGTSIKLALMLHAVS